MTDMIYDHLYGSYLHFAKWEGQLAASRNWPLWAMRSIEILSLLSLLAVRLSWSSSSSKPEKGEDETDDVGGTSSRKKGKGGNNKLQVSESSIEVVRNSVSFRMFQLQYLSVYLIVMLADWLQGPTMFTLYTSEEYVNNGVDVGVLFITGFMSSALFGTFIGVYVDTWGRKLGCVIFCVLEIVINTLEHVSSLSLSPPPLSRSRCCFLPSFVKVSTLISAFSHAYLNLDPGSYIASLRFQICPV